MEKQERKHPPRTTAENALAPNMAGLQQRLECSPGLLHTLPMFLDELLSLPPYQLFFGKFYPILSPY